MCVQVRDSEEQITIGREGGRGALGDFTATGGGGGQRKGTLTLRLNPSQDTMTSLLSSCLYPYY